VDTSCGQGVVVVSVNYVEDQGEIGQGQDVLRVRVNYSQDVLRRQL